MFKRLISTQNDVVLTVLRLALGIAMFPHGAQKVLGWFGGYGWSGTMGFFTGAMGLPTLLAALAILAEFTGALGLITGFLSRLAALNIAAVMTGAILMVHASNGFFMNWSGNQKGEGYEYHLLALALAIAIFIRGGGALSVDQELSKRL